MDCSSNNENYPIFNGYKRNFACSSQKQTLNGSQQRSESITEQDFMPTIESPMFEYEHDRSNNTYMAQTDDEP